MNDREWHSGPPPHIGWWNASITRHQCHWRWWDGKVWSLPIDPRFSRIEAGRYAAQISNLQHGIFWTDYWPENARVPRINPGTDNREWRTGPPPYPGWWNASAVKNPNMLRWWDGEVWSEAIRDTPSPATPEYFASVVSCLQHYVKWTYRWPKNARVPRIKS